MEKKTCKNCGKIWIIERFDDHYCPVVPKKTRKPRTKSVPEKSTIEMGKEAAVEGPPIISFNRIIT
jgi:hypothetical protein